MSYIISRAQQELHNISFDQDLTHVLKTPNRLLKHQELDGWQNDIEHPSESPDRKIKIQPSFKIKSTKPFRNFVNKQANQNFFSFIENKQNTRTDKVFSINPQKIQSPQKVDFTKRNIGTSLQIRKSFKLADLDPKNSLFSTPTNNKDIYASPQSTSRSVHRRSFKRLSNTEAINKINLFSLSDKREKNQFLYNDHLDSEITEKFPQESQVQNDLQPFVPFSEQLNQPQPSFFQNPQSFKIPISTILYPVLKRNSKKSHRTIDRFHSFVARTVRK